MSNCYIVDIDYTTIVHYQKVTMKKSEWYGLCVMCTMVFLIINFFSPQTQFNKWLSTKIRQARFQAKKKEQEDQF